MLKPVFKSDIILLLALNYARIIILSSHLELFILQFEYLCARDIRTDRTFIHFKGTIPGFDAFDHRQFERLRLEEAHPCRVTVLMPHS